MSPGIQKTHPDEVWIREGETPFQEHVEMGAHELLADEPQDHGGTGSGPSPYELLLASLGACTAMTIRMYADRKQWPLETIQIKLSHQKIHAEDCKDCETKEGRIDFIERTVFLKGPLDETQRQQLLEIAERCPVRRSLTSEIHIESKLGGSSSAS